MNIFSLYSTGMIGITFKKLIILYLIDKLYTLFHKRILRIKKRITHKPLYNKGDPQKCPET